MIRMVLVVYYKWRQVGGPSGNTVLDSTYPKTRIAGLVAGTYVYRLTVTDNGWDSSAATMTVVVSELTSGNVPPTVSAWQRNQTIQLPTSSVTLTGTATGNSGATISTYRVDGGQRTGNGDDRHGGRVVDGSVGADDGGDLCFSVEVRRITTT
jgi:hypothetical protein